ncbi:MAG: methyl-accepting chemotaxis protein [Magnetococcales bacterium]|nr:methyl-accepting chemotaxis protein [Magnetococcales bacterium]
MKMRLSVKLISLFLLFGLVPLILLGVLLGQQAVDALRGKSLALLDAVRESRKHQIELYFQERMSDIAILAETVAVEDTLQLGHRLQHEAAAAGRPIGTPEWQAAINTPLSQFLSQYKSVLGYYDLFLIADDGHVAFTVGHESDLGADLLRGGLKESGLARLFAKARNGVAVEDFAPYAPSKGEHAAFIGAPIKRNGKWLGVVALQLSTEAIDKIMQERTGMGQTGESYLVGQAGNQISYRSNRAVGEGKIGQLRSQASSHDFLDRAVKGESGSESRIGAAGQWKDIPVLSSYAPVTVPGLQWAIVSVMAESEAFASVHTLNRSILLVGTSCGIIVVVVGWFFSRTISQPLQQVIHVISSSSAQMAASLTEQERVASQQAASVNETNTTMEELGASARQSAEQAELAANGADKALELSQFGMSRVESTLANMDQAKAKVEAIAQQILLLSEKTGQIRDIANLVSDFANETKMLAMNAAVEAVRAGEHGKGFAVLAMETRKLADESKRSAGKINALVAEVQKANNATVMATEEGSKTVAEGIVISQNTAETFREVAQSMDSASRGAQQISLNIRQQSVAIRQVVEAMKSVNAGARESVAGMSQVKEGIRTLNEAAQTLQRMV